MLPRRRSKVKQNCTRFLLVVLRRFRSMPSPGPSNIMQLLTKKSVNLLLVCRLLLLAAALCQHGRGCRKPSTKVRCAEVRVNVSRRPRSLACESFGRKLVTFLSVLFRISSGQIAQTFDLLSKVGDAWYDPSFRMSDGLLFRPRS